MCMLRFLSSGAGWFHRRATGKGRKIRVSIYESIVRFQMMTFENYVHFYDLLCWAQYIFNVFIFNRKGGICPLLRNGAMEATEALSVVPVVAILMTLGACILTEFPHGCHSKKVLHYIPNHNPVTLWNSANACCDTFGSCSLHFPIIASLRIATRSFSFNEMSEKESNESKKTLLLLLSFPLWWKRTHLQTETLCDWNRGFGQSNLQVMHDLAHLPFGHSFVCAFPWFIRKLMFFCLWMLIILGSRFCDEDVHATLKLLSWNKQQQGSFIVQVRCDVGLFLPLSHRCLQLPQRVRGVGFLRCHRWELAICYRGVFILRVAYSDEELVQMFHIVFEMKHL